MEEISQQITKNARVPINSWIPYWEIEEGAQAQLRDAVTHPYVTEHMAVFPDIHQGYGIPVGTAFVTEGVVIPNAVGVDIGCGIAATRLDLLYDAEKHDARFWGAWANKVRSAVPTGFGMHEKAHAEANSYDFYLWDSLEAPIAKDLMPKAAKQLGTLGGGNHFLEAGLDEGGYIWVLVHSGSRGIGNQLAAYYHKQAIEQLEEGVPKNLAVLHLDSELGKQYMNDMRWCMAYAHSSRDIMINELRMALDVWAEGSKFTFGDTVHNAAWEYDDKVLHRKGSTSLWEGSASVIPGSMGANSYIVSGIKRDPFDVFSDSLESCSHGAGRQMSRSKAKQSFDLTDLELQLDGTHTKASQGIMDEAPNAYKNIDKVIQQQLDLFDIKYKIRPLITVKGDAKARDD